MKCHCQGNFDKGIVRSLYFIMAHATADPWKSVSKPPSDVELTKALALLGFGSWTALEPSM